jgi:iron complex transport system substrate-binding protein
MAGSPQRIVSLLPSATEILCALGLRDRLVGVSHECDWPEDVAALPAVTRSRIPKGLASSAIDGLVREQLASERALYHLDLPLLERLAPDLLVTQALCDVCAVAADEVEAAACALPGVPRVLNLEPMSLADVFTTLRLVGEATGVTATANRVVAGLESRIDALCALLKDQPEPRVAFLEWVDPPFNGGHWTPELIALARGVDVFGAAGQPSRMRSLAEIEALEPDVVVIACCGFGIPRAAEDLPGLVAVPGWLSLPAVRTGRVYLTDGNHYFNRPGPRLVDSLEILARALHPGRFAGDAPGPLMAVGRDGSIRPAPLTETRTPNRVTIRSPWPTA